MAPTVSTKSIAQGRAASCLLLDLDNLYFATRAKFSGRKIQVSKYLEAAGNPQIRIAYSRQKLKDCPKFVSQLLRLNFRLEFGHSTCPILMALDVASLDVDKVIVGSNHEQMLPILAWVASRKKVAQCFACGIPLAFKPYAECVEIQEELLDDPSEVT